MPGREWKSIFTTVAFAKRKGVLLFVLVPCVLVFAYFLLWGTVRSSTFRGWVETELSQRTGHDVSVGALRLTRFFQIAATTVTVSRAGTVVFRSPSIVFSASPLDLVQGTIGHLTVQNPFLRLNLKGLAGPGSTGPPAVSVRNLTILDGDIFIEGNPPITVGSIDLNAKNVDVAGEAALSLQAYLPWLDGTAVLSVPSGLEKAELSLTRAREGLIQDVLKVSFNFKRENGEHVAVASGNLTNFPLGEKVISGSLRSRLNVGPGLAQLDGLLEVSLSEFPQKIGGFLIPPDQSGPAVVTVDGSYASAKNLFIFREAKLALGSASLSSKGTIRQVQDGRYEISASGEFSGINVGTDLDVLTFNGRGKAELTLSGPLIAPSGKGTIESDSMKVHGEGFALTASLLRIPFEFTDSSFQSRGARIEAKGLRSGRTGAHVYRVGELDFRGNIVKSESRFELKGDFQMRDGSFAARDQSKIAEGFAAAGTVALSDTPQGSHVKGRLEVTGLQLLWDKFFGDFKGQQLKLDLDSEYLKDTDQLKIRHLQLEQRSVGRLDLNGAVQTPFGEPTFQLDIQSRELRPGSIYEFFIRDTFKRTYPYLEEIKLAGTCRLAIQTTGSPASLSVRGDFAWQQGGIRYTGDRWQLGPVQLSLPFQLSFPAGRPGAEATTPRTADLTIQSASFGGITIPAVRTRFLLWDNMLEVLQPMRIPMYGGSVQIDRLRWNDIGAPANKVSLALQLDDLELKSLTQDLGWNHFGGTLSGSIPDVQWAGDSLRTEGKVTLELFDGSIVLRGLEIERPLSPVQSIKLDAAIDGIHLERASETLEFGRISGILTGSVEDLEIQNGQASRFRANLQTVKRPGVDQKISVEALNQITVLSSGAEASSLYLGLGRLFETFRYSRLGFKAVLKNDRLTLRGVESRNGQEYLVVGSFLPPSVNVISHTQEIGFSELMRRLERIRDRKKEP